MITQTTDLAQLLEQAATDVDLRNFGELRRSLRRRLAREHVDHRLIWVATIADFQAGCRQLAAQLASGAVMTEHIRIPIAGDWIRTDHHCWWNDPTAEHPATLHNAPIQVGRVVKLKDGQRRIEATRCDGTTIHLVVDAQGVEQLQPWDAARAGYEIVPAPEDD